MSKRQKPDRSGMVSAIAAATGKPHPLGPQSAVLGSRPKSREGKVAFGFGLDQIVERQLGNRLLEPVVSCSSSSSRLA